MINERTVGSGSRVYVVAELSANHFRDFELTVKTIKAAKDAGADALKIQTYTADALTIKSNRPEFRINDGLWAGWALHDLYDTAYMPWEWQPKLAALCKDLGIDFFSTPTDLKAVAFLQDIGVPAYKVASFELTHVPLLLAVAKTGKPVILSTGMATVEEIDFAVHIIKRYQPHGPILLKCTSAYPAKPGDANIRTLEDMRARWNVPIGLSDHTLGHAVAVCAVAAGACVVEKHFTLDRALGGFDAPFSMMPDEFADLVRAIRDTENVLGAVKYGPTEAEKDSVLLRRSLYTAQPIEGGEVITPEHICVIRPHAGIDAMQYERVVGAKAMRNLDAGVPIQWHDIDA